MDTRVFTTITLAAAMLTTVALAFQAGDVFQVQSITPMGGGRVDVKLVNERTHYVHSETVLEVDITFAVGDVIMIASEPGGRRSFRKVGSPEKPQPAPPGPNGPFKLGTCGGGEPSLSDWNKRLVARMNLEWQKSSKSIAGRSPYFNCNVSYKVGRNRLLGNMEISLNDVTCYPPDFANSMRRFMFDFPINDIPFPKGVMDGTEVSKSATFSVGAGTGYSRGKFVDQTVQVTWPDKSVK